MHQTGTSHRMHDYFVPEFEFIAYIAGYAPISGREQFLRRMATHPSSYEMLIPEDIMIDVKRKIAVALIKADVSDTATGKLLVTKRYQAIYQLVPDQNSAIKIRKVLFFEEVLPRGALDLNQVFGKDWGK